jgi:hypothetical protein
MAQVLGGAGLSQIDSVACGTVAGCFSASMFGLLYDRSIVPDFQKSYQALTRHLFKGADGEYDPRQRIAYFGIPLAFATFIVPVLAPWLWAFKQDLLWVSMYVIAGILSVAATMIIGRMTAEHRLLEHETAFNTTPLAANVQPKAAAKVQPQRAPSPAQGRRQALLAIALGFGTLALNHYFVVSDHTYYQKAAFLAPMVIVIGIFGLFEPRLMSRHLPIGKTYPKSVLLLMLLAIAIGGVLGFQIDAWYHAGYGG